MTNTRNLVLSAALLLSVALTGCKSNPIGDMTKYKDELCACKDKACVDKVDEKFEKEMKDKYSDEQMKNMDEGDMAKVMAIMAEAAACQMKLQAPEGAAEAAAAAAGEAHAAAGEAHAAAGEAMEAAGEAAEAGKAAAGEAMEAAGEAAEAGKAAAGKAAEAVKAATP